MFSETPTFMIDGNRSCVDSAVHDVFAVVAASSHLQHTNVRQCSVQLRFTVSGLGVGGLASCG